MLRGGQPPCKGSSQVLGGAQGAWSGGQTGEPRLMAKPPKEM